MRDPGSGYAADIETKEDVTRKDGWIICKTVLEPAIQATEQNTRDNIAREKAVMIDKQGNQVERYSNSAWAMMTNMGYQRWQGLGKKGQGNIEPLGHAIH